MPQQQRPAWLRLLDDIEEFFPARGHIHVLDRLKLIPNAHLNRNALDGPRRYGRDSD
jgi:hypothetical protein